MWPSFSFDMRALEYAEYEATWPIPAGIGSIQAKRFVLASLKYRVVQVHGVYKTSVGDFTVAEGTGTYVSNAACHVAVINGQLRISTNGGPWMPHNPSATEAIITGGVRMVERRAQLDAQLDAQFARVKAQMDELEMSGDSGLLTRLGRWLVGWFP